MSELAFHGPGLLLIENVGNLVCPSSYDLGEEAKIVLLSITEGEDEPLRYPGIVHRASLMILTKKDLLPHVEFDTRLALENGRKAIRKSLTSLSRRVPGEGFDRWLTWLNDLQQKAQREAAAASS